MSSNKISNGSGGGSVASGSMSDPYYRQVMGGGNGFLYSSCSGREMRRFIARKQRIQMKKYGHLRGEVM